MNKKALLRNKKVNNAKQANTYIMSIGLLKTYIKLMMQESQARVPNQLLPIDSDKDDSESSDESFNEFCGVGSGTIMGSVSSSDDTQNK